MKKTLILVDLQNDFLPGGSLAVPKGDEVIPVANWVIPRFELVVATQDWHPADHGSFASQHEGSEVGESFNLGGVMQALWPDHCIQGTRGAEFSDGLDLMGVHRIFRKGMDKSMDSYSGFFDNDHINDTGLGDYLKSRAEEVTVMGLATDYCVQATVLDALGLGFKVRLLLDGCRAVDVAKGDGERALEKMQRVGATITTKEGV